MTIYVDADACPVTDAVIAEAAKEEIPVVLVCDPAHEMQREGARTIVVTRAVTAQTTASPIWRGTETLL